MQLYEFEAYLDDLVGSYGEAEYRMIELLKLHGKLQQKRLVQIPNLVKKYTY